MKYQAYDEYRDSGVKWLGKLPEHWECIKLKYVAKLEGDKIEPSSQYHYVGMENVEPGNGKYLTKENINPAGLSTLFLEGDVLFGKLRPYLAKSWLANFTGICSSEFLVLRSRKVNPKFLNYFTLTEEFINQVDSSTYGSKMPRASWDFISLMGIPVPEYEGSQKIVCFLDHETAKIDTLIEKQQQLIKLLKEKRQAVISHAVTKGLNPNALMRDSGVKWLGEVPEHWDIVPLKYISLIRYGIGEPPKYQEEGIPLVRATNIRSGKVSKDNLVFVNPRDIPENRIVWLDTGDIVVVRSGAGTGDSSIIPKEYKGSIAGFNMVVTPINCVSDFLGHVLLSNYARINQMDLKKTRAAQPHLNAEELGGCFILTPSRIEQEEIALYLDKEIMKFDRLMGKANNVVKLMQERRTALISAAVTGKIDIRNWQAPNKENKEVSA